MICQTIDQGDKETYFDQQNDSDQDRQAMKNADTNKNRKQFDDPLNSNNDNTKDTRNCQEKVNKISHLKPNQLAPSIYIMKELCFFSLDQWEISIHLLWGKCFNIPHNCDPHLNQTKLNGLLPLTIPGVLAMSQVDINFAIRMKTVKIDLDVRMKK